MHLLGVKPTLQKDLEGIPVITHTKTLKLPKHFDARTAWPQCSTIGKILGRLLDSFSSYFDDFFVLDVLMPSIFHITCWFHSTSKIR